MCRLLGLISKDVIDVRYWMLDAQRPFVGWSDEHCHGWGIGWYEDGGLRLEKEPVPARQSEKFAETSKNAKSRAFVCHLRKATCGLQTQCNSQPFRSANWLFGHNGTVDRDYLMAKLTDTQRSMEGDTDSEVYFRWLLQNLVEGGVEGIRRAIDEVKTRAFTALNFIMSDGHTMFAYWEQAPAVKVPEKYYQLYCADIKDSHGSVVVCSEKLDSQSWVEIPQKTLLIVAEDLKVELVSFSSR
jgi:predicted glutamine amidotransferase